MSIRRNEVEAAMDPVVNDILSVQSTLIFQIPVEIINLTLYVTITILVRKYATYLSNC